MGLRISKRTCGSSASKKESGSLLYHQESGLNPIVGDAIPHHPGFSERQHVPEFNDLTGVERGVAVHGPKAALAMIHQSSANILTRGIVEVEMQNAFTGMTALCAAICSGHGLR
jgi:hypothetical protein